MTETRTGRARLVAAGGATAALALGLSACGSVTGGILNHVTHGLVGGNAALNTFTGKVKTGNLSSYDVTYVTTGSSPETVEYAAQQPNDFYFAGNDNSGSGAFKIVQNSSGEYYCTQGALPTGTTVSGSTGVSQGATGSGATGASGGTGATGATGATGSTTTTSSTSTTTTAPSSAAWSCLKVGTAQQNTYQGLFQFYTGAYWVGVLQAYSSLAGIAGVHIRSTSMTVNGFQMSCIVVSGGSGSEANQSSTYCVTSQGILGYVASSGSSSNFEIKSFSSSPSSSLFQLPAGATINTLPTST